MILIDIEMPENCTVCPIKTYDADYRDACPTTGVPCLNIGRQAQCPLRELPKERDLYTWMSDGDYLRTCGWNQCVTYMKGMKENEEETDNSSCDIGDACPIDLD